MATLSAPLRSASLDVFDRAQAACDGERDEHVLRRPADHIENVVAAVEAGHDVDVEDLVDAVREVAMRKGLRIAHDAQSLEVDALHEVRRLDVEAGDESRRRHRQSSAIHRPVALERLQASMMRWTW